MIRIVQAAPFQAVQDGGRAMGRTLGIPQSGAMDPELLHSVNLLVGNQPGMAALEWALGPTTIGFDHPAVVAWAGADGAGGDRHAWAAHPIPAGTTLELGVPADRFGYLAVAGGIAVPEVFGSRSTYLPGGFGGLAGRLLRTGDELPVRPPSAGEHTGRMSRRAGQRLPDELRPGPGPVRVLEGPQAHFFGPEAWEALLGARYQVATGADRMGYRLEGPALTHSGPSALPSEAACPGAIQVPHGGTPIVLMPDGPTVGGYPKLAVVIGPDLGRLAQHRPGSRPGFVRIPLDEARAAVEAMHGRRAAVAAWVSGNG